LKFYWDTAAAINATISPAVYDRLAQGEHFTRSHTFWEFFSIMTGRGIGLVDDRGQVFDLVMTADTAAKWLRGFAARLTIVDLDAEEALAGLDKAQSLSVTGAKVYDYGHALAARKAKADAILTRNTKDFQTLSRIKVEWP
jgi:hypothetical protein